MIKDNFYGMCPAKTYGGAIFTDWRSPDYREHNIIYVNKINGDNHEYRHFLQKNSLKIMRNQLRDLEKISKCQLSTCVYDKNKKELINKNKNIDPRDSCDRTILGYGFPIIHNYPTRMDPRLFKQENKKYDKFVSKYWNDQ